MCNNEKSDTSTTVVDVLMEFMEAAIHNILFARKLYPEVIFSSYQKYGCAINKSMHPDLNEYIENCLSAAAYFAKKEKLSKVVLCFIKRFEIIEKVVFDVMALKTSFDKDQYLIDTESSFRNFFLKLLYRRNILKPLEGDCNFVMHIHTSKSEAVDYMNKPENQDFPWLHTDNDNDNTNQSNVIPLLSVDKNSLQLQVYFIGQTNEES